MSMTVGPGLSNFVKKLEDFQGENVAGRCVYVGAGLLIEEVKKQVDNIPTRKAASQKNPGEKVTGLTEEQKRGIRDGLGISRAKVDGDEVNVTIGVDGYNNTKTKRWPQGQPNAMVARSIEKGTNWLNRHAFVAPAYRSAKDAAEKAMAEEYDKEVERIMGGN